MILETCKKVIQRYTRVKASSNLQFRNNRNQLFSVLSYEALCWLV